MDQKIFNIILVLSFISYVFSGGARVINPGCRRFDTSGTCL